MLEAGPFPYIKRVSTYSDKYIRARSCWCCHRVNCPLELLCIQVLIARIGGLSVDYTPLGYPEQRQVSDVRHGQVQLPPMKDALVLQDKLDDLGCEKEGDIRDCEIHPLGILKGWEKR